jgi:acyl-coenzyme A synthetase/AMP-(fatty) acid ligase
MTHHPIIERPADDVFAVVDQQAITAGQFCADVAAAMPQLPDTRHVINLCQSRYGFMVAFFAVAVSGRINLLPGQRTAAGLQGLSADFPDSVVLTDSPDYGNAVQLKVSPGAHGRAPIPVIDDTAVVALPFTSGSTGEPQAHPKTWAMFADWRNVHWRHVPESLRAPALLIATVPAWHMYGLEWSLLVPTIAPWTVYCGPDFYPQDVLGAMDSHAGHSVLVTTPLHLRALVRARAPAQPVLMVVCATAPLEASLVATAETNLRTHIHEIYGCSEIGSLAWRNPSAGPDWQFFDCFEPGLGDSGVVIDHPYLPAAVTLPDVFTPGERGGYRLLGRTADIVKVGGRRESLSGLNTQLVSTPGIVDGVFYDPETYGLPATGRLGAVVVAPGLDAREVRRRLAGQMDAVFLPRPMFLVDELPRDNTSKLKRDALQALLERLHG